MYLMVDRDVAMKVVLQKHVYSVVWWHSEIRWVKKVCN